MREESATSDSAEIIYPKSPLSQAAFEDESNKEADLTSQHSIPIEDQQQVGEDGFTAVPLTHKDVLRANLDSAEAVAHPDHSVTPLPVKDEEHRLPVSSKDLEEPVGTEMTTETLDLAKTQPTTH